MNIAKKESRKALFFCYGLISVQKAGVADRVTDVLCNTFVTPLLVLYIVGVMDIYEGFANSAVYGSKEQTIPWMKEERQHDGQRIQAAEPFSTD